MSDDLITWLRVVLDTIEASTRTQLYWAQQTILTLQDPKLLGKHIPGWHDWPEVMRLCRERLREVEAKRKLIKRYENAASVHPALASFIRGQDDGYREACLDAIRDAAEVYADRPGYRESWKPEGA